MKRKRILALAHFFHPKEMQGIVTYARQANWGLRFVISSQESLPDEWQGDGMIIIHSFHSDEMMKFLDQHQVPSVIIGRGKLPGKNFPSVWYNVEAMALKGAHYFIRGGHRHIAYLNYRDVGEPPELGLFRAAVLDAGRQFISIRVASLKKDLKRAPRPLALMCPDDSWAVEIYHACEKLKISIPEEIALLGSSNVHHHSELNYVPLSTVDTHTEECGFRAAEILDQLLAGKSCDSPIIIEPGEIIVRESTSIPPMEDLRVAKAIKLILKNFHKALSLDEIASECGLGRWALDAAFKKNCGQTMNAYLEGCRLSEAEQLLKLSSMRINEISTHVGYANHVSFLRAFQRHRDSSPSQYRKSVRGIE